MPHQPSWIDEKIVAEKKILNMHKNTVSFHFEKRVFSLGESHLLNG